MFDIIQIHNMEILKKILSDFSSILIPPLNEKVDDLEIYAKKLIDNGFIYGALLSNQIIGFISFYANDIDNGIAYISLIVVSPGSQGLGVGKSLLNICESVSRKHGMEKLRLQVYTMNEKAIRFYTHHNFITICHVNTDSIYMEKFLYEK